MKKGTWFVLALGLLCLLAGCQSQAEPKDEAVAKTPSQKIDIQGSQELEGRTVLKAPDIYVMNGRGCVLEWNSIRNVVVMVEDQEQWNALWDRGESWNAKGIPEYTVPFLGEAFVAMCDQEKYPLDQYTYFFSYDEVSSGGYSYHADKVILDGDIIHFGLDESSHGPETDYVPDMMDGFWYFAAIPKELIGEKKFRNVIAPGGEAYFSEKLRAGETHAWYYADNVAGEELAERYGEQLYVIRSQEEYEAFLAKAGDAEIRRKAFFSQEIDFDKQVFACTFLKTAEKKTRLYFSDNGYKVLKDGRIRIYYSCDEEGAGASKRTSMLCQFLPKAIYEQELEEARNAAGGAWEENEQPYPQEASITHEGYAEKDGEYALVFGVLDPGGEEREIELPVEVSNAVLRATWISENLLGIETHVNPSTSIYYVYDVATETALRSYAGSSFAVIPGTDHIMYEENIPHFSHESMKHSYYIDDELFYTAERADYQLGTPVFSKDLTQVAFTAHYVDDEQISDGKTYPPCLYVCDVSWSSFSMKAKIMMTISQEGFEGAFFDEDNELRVMIDGVMYAYHGGELSLFRE